MTSVEGRHIDDPAITAVREALESGAWEEARSLLGDASAAQREWIFAHLHGDGPAVGIDRWVAADPTAADAHIARGASLLLRARAGRAAGGDDETFWETLRSAERELFEGIELQFSDPVPFTLLLRSGLSLRIPFEELCMRYDESVRRQPELIGAHLATLEALSPLGMGSEEEMFAFARTTARAADEGSLLHGLVPFAHLISSVLGTSVDRRKTFLSGQRASEIQMFATMSVDNAAWTGAPGSAEVVNIFAAAFAAAGEVDRARALMARATTPRTERPWSILPDGDALFEVVADRGP